ncbi:hypothetical protein BKA70DRAFT_1237482 [Coprinopsis sp. MPI-PUGE-AT-0042]|nr:hypothetical protein BKA70DRAFT_1451075 [Coprinopsis sp. MPI-PUGE-AT-0042]KAH6885042.1 hypothetical protein BKA70DRAFT_1237482 [Coprinopsis sp. MPI-PUGE-AT-0042]
MDTLSTGVTPRRVRSRSFERSQREAEAEAADRAEAEAIDRAKQAEAADRAALNALGPTKRRKHVRFLKANQVREFEVQSESDSESPPEPPSTQTPPQKVDDHRTSPTSHKAKHSDVAPRSQLTSSPSYINQATATSEVALKRGAPTGGFVSFEIRFTGSYRFGVAFVIFATGFLAGAFTIIACILLLSHTPTSYKMSEEASDGLPMLYVA